jgi:hypothetical protein
MLVMLRILFVAVMVIILMVIDSGYSFSSTVVYLMSFDVVPNISSRMILYKVLVVMGFPVSIFSRLSLHMVPGVIHRQLIAIVVTAVEVVLVDPPGGRTIVVGYLNTR